jgi:hypothetical protein
MYSKAFESSKQLLKVIFAINKDTSLGRATAHVS